MKHNNLKLKRIKGMELPLEAEPRILPAWDMLTALKQEGIRKKPSPLCIPMRQSW